MLAYFAILASPLIALFGSENGKCKIAIIGSDRVGTNKELVDRVRLLAQGLNKDKFILVYDGGTKGIRYSMVETFQKQGGEVVAYAIPEEKTGIPASVQTVMFDNDFARFKQMYDDAKVFILLPGGIESIAEISWVIDQNALKKREVPIIVYNCLGYWDRFFQMVGFFEKEGFLDHRRLFQRLVKNETQVESIYSHLNYLVNDSKKGTKK